MLEILVCVSRRESNSVCRFPPLDLMASTKAWCFVLLVLSTFLCCSGQSPGNASVDANSLNAVIRNYALRGSIQLRTGLAYQVPLPANFSGMEASAMRLRIGSLWTRGANISGFRIPPRTLAVPFQRRLVLVYQNLGNWSDSYYRVSGYSAVTPVVGLLAYSAPNNSSSAFGGVVQLDLSVTGYPISVRFARASLPQGTASAARCAKFEPNGTVHLGEVATSNVCTTRSLGHLAIVVPSPAPPPAPSPGIPAEATGRNGASWRVWLVACGAVAVGLVLVGLAGGGIFLLVKNKRMKEMEEQAEAGEVLKTVWVGSSRMPLATMVRTRPMLENMSAP